MEFLNSNPSEDQVDTFLTLWRERSLEQMEKFKAYRKEKLDSGSKEDWEWLTDRKITNLIF